MKRGCRLRRISHAQMQIRSLAFAGGFAQLELKFQGNDAINFLKLKVAFLIASNVPSLF